MIRLQLHTVQFYWSISHYRCVQTTDRLRSIRDKRKEYAHMYMYDQVLLQRKKENFWSTVCAEYTYKFNEKMEIKIEARLFFNRTKTFIIISEIFVHHPFKRNMKWKKCRDCFWQHCNNLLQVLFSMLFELFLFIV